MHGQLEVASEWDEAIAAEEMESLRQAGLLAFWEHRSAEPVAPLGHDDRSYTIYPPYRSVQPYQRVYNGIARMKDDSKNDSEPPVIDLTSGYMFCHAGFHHIQGNLARTAGVLIPVVRQPNQKVRTTVVFDVNWSMFAWANKDFNEKAFASFSVSVSLVGRKYQIVNSWGTYADRVDAHKSAPERSGSGEAGFMFEHSPTQTEPLPMAAQVILYTVAGSDGYKHSGGGVAVGCVVKGIQIELI